MQHFCVFVQCNALWYWMTTASLKCRLQFCIFVLLYFRFSEVKLFQQNKEVSYLIYRLKCLYVEGKSESVCCSKPKKVFEHSVLLQQCILSGKAVVVHYFFAIYATFHFVKSAPMLSTHFLQFTLFCSKNNHIKKKKDFTAGV